MKSWKHTLKEAICIMALVVTFERDAKNELILVVEKDDVRHAFKVQDEDLESEEFIDKVVANVQAGNSKSKKSQP